MLYSEFDTNLLSLTTIPVIGFWKLLPTFGGCVLTASSVSLSESGSLDMEVQYTTSRPVQGLSGLRPLPGEWGYKIADAIWNLKVPTGAACNPARRRRPTPSSRRPSPIWTAGAGRRGLEAATMEPGPEHVT